MVQVCNRLQESYHKRVSDILVRCSGHDKGYIDQLCDSSVLLMSRHLCDMFIKGFHLSSRVWRIACNLLMDKDNPFDYVMTYCMSQDHIRQLLLKNSIHCSKNANYLEMETDFCSPIFSFKWNSTRSTPLVLLPSDEENSMEMLQRQEDMKLSDLPT